MLPNSSTMRAARDKGESSISMRAPTLGGWLLLRATCLRAEKNRSEAKRLFSRTSRPASPLICARPSRSTTFRFSRVTRKVMMKLANTPRENRAMMIQVMRLVSCSTKSQTSVSW